MSWHAVKEEQQQIPSANKSNRLQANAARLEKIEEKKNNTKTKPNKENAKR